MLLLLLLASSWCCSQSFVPVQTNQHTPLAKAISLIEYKFARHLTTCEKKHWQQLKSKPQMNNK
jgi:hypothetical protein